MCYIAFLQANCSLFALSLDSAQICFANRFAPLRVCTGNLLRASLAPYPFKKTPFKPLKTALAAFFYRLTDLPLASQSGRLKTAEARRFESARRLRRFSEGVARRENRMGRLRRRTQPCCLMVRLKRIHGQIVASRTQISSTVAEYPLIN